MTCNRKQHTPRNLLISLACAAWLHVAPALADDAPLLVHQGQTVSVPAQSPYRGRIAVATVTAISAAHDLELPAVVEADPARTVNVLPSLTGHLLDLRVSLGQTVHKGQVLARLQSSDLLQAGSDLQKAQDARGLALKARDRARAVQQAGGNADKDMEAAQSALVQAQSELDRAQQRLAGMGIDRVGDLKQLSLPVTAPVSGVVTALNVGANAQVNDATASLMTIADLSQVYVSAQVPEYLLPRLRVGQPLSVNLVAQPDLPLKGRVSSIGAVLDPDTRRTAVRAVFANPQGLLRPNMFATAHVMLSQDASPAVPLSALIMNNDRVVVFVETRPWTFEPRVVELGSEDREMARIRSGLKAGERVVVRGGVLLND